MFMLMQVKQADERAHNAQKNDCQPPHYEEKTSDISVNNGHIPNIDDTQTWGPPSYLFNTDIFYFAAAQLAQRARS